MTDAFEKLEAILQKFPDLVVAGGGVERNLIHEAEVALGVKFPEPISEYFRRFGYIRVAAAEFGGLVKTIPASSQPLVLETIELRLSWDLCPHYLPIFADDRYHFMIDLLSPNARVINWILGISPNKQRTHSGCHEVANDFIDFIVSEANLLLRAWQTAKFFNPGEFGDLKMGDA